MIERPLWYVDFYDKNNRLLNLSNNICYDALLLEELPSIIDYENFFKYPDAADTYHTLSKHHRIDVKNLAIGYGSGELLLRILEQLTEYSIGIQIPTYELISSYATNLGMSVVTSHESNNIDADILYIANPNGITGKAISKEEILLLTARYQFVIVDEAYGEFNTIGCSVLDNSVELPNLIVVKTLSKSIASPGLRFGYCSAHASFINKLQNNRPSTVITGAVQQLVPPLLSAIPAHIERMLITRSYIESNYDCVPSQGNFVLFNKNPELPCQIKKTSQGLYRMALTDINTFKRLENG
jgi:histidinol-phosphate/aromatic aminotransferase/cobyric acid decarboxylase-like protein